MQGVGVDDGTRGDVEPTMGRRCGGGHGAEVRWCAPAFAEPLADRSR